MDPQKALTMVILRLVSVEASAVIVYFPVDIDMNPLHRHTSDRLDRIAHAACNRFLALCMRLQLDAERDGVERNSLHKYTTLLRAQ